MNYDLLICIRCHTAPELVLDTIESVQQFTSRNTTCVMAAVDGNNTQLANILSPHLDSKVYLSGTRWGWGVGLYGLLAESIKWARERISFAHFITIDYDTLFIGPGVDQAVLDLIESSEIGIIGNYKKQNVHWAHTFCRERIKIRQKLGPIPATYTPGEGVQGGLFCITHRMLEEMKRRGMFSPPWNVAKCFTRLADDHLIMLYMRYCELEVRSLTEKFHIEWQLEMDTFDMIDKGIIAFHPTKVKPGRAAGATEKRVREYFRNIRRSK